MAILTTHNLTHSKPDKIMIQHLIIGLLAETSIHPGAGRSVSVVDLPVAREAATDYPVLVGSSLKGALKQWAETNGLNGQLNAVFGQHDNAGSLLVSDARLLLLPVRSLNSAYKWVTCPHLLERLRRDFGRAGLNINLPDVGVEEGKAVTNGSKEEHLFLEERQFEFAARPEEKLIEAIQPLMTHYPPKSVLVSNWSF